MNSRLVHNRSSYLVIWPIIIAMFICCLLSFIFKSYFLSLILLIAFLVILASRLWSMQAIKKLDFSIRVSQTGYFPGETAVFRIEIKNEKFLPVMCTQLFCPLSRNLCLEPEDVRNAEEYEKTWLADLDASQEKVGEKQIPTLLWYESRSTSSKWMAKRRGLYSTSGWKLRTGDGFGISQMETAVKKEDCRQIAVYPELVPVRTNLFLRMAWSADTGVRGVMEDPTVIRSTRDYQASDSVKHINWRLTARGLPLSVNVYEEILPQSVFFVFDGESFSGKEKHLQEMEDALSLLSSAIVTLEGKVRAGISFSEDHAGVRQCSETGAELENILWAFARYQPKADVTDEDNKVIDLQPQFDLDFILGEVQRTGRFYYVTYDAGTLKENALLQEIDHDKTTILSYCEAGAYLDFETLCLDVLRDGRSDDNINSGTTADPSADRITVPESEDAAYGPQAEQEVPDAE